MSAKGWLKGNGDNALPYASNVRARTRAHARVIADDPSVATVASVANIDEWPTTRHFESVAQTVAKHRTVATAVNRSQAPVQFLWTIAGLLADVMGFQQNAAAERSPRGNVSTKRSIVFANCWLTSSRNRMAGATAYRSSPLRCWHGALFATALAERVGLVRAFR